MSDTIPTASDRRGWSASTAPAAAVAGLRRTDVILELDGVAVDSAGDLQRRMISDVIGHSLAVRVLRGDDVHEIVVTPAELIE